MRPDIRAQQVKEIIKARFFPIIPRVEATWTARWTAEEHERNRLSRSLAAFSIGKLAGIGDAEAVNSVIDAGGDNGIDAIVFDPVTGILFAGQAKAGAAPDFGDNKKFCDGIRDLLRRNFHKFNEGFMRFLPDIEVALDTPGVKILAFVTYLAGGLGEHATRDLDELTAELNAFTHRFDWRDCGLAEIHQLLAAERIVDKLDTELSIENWNGLTQPRKVYFGVVRASDLADLYQTHGKKIFEKNIRHYLGDVTVNNAIQDTVLNKPEDLLILNNGLTIVCDSIGLPLGYSHDKAIFTLKGFSVVNGAQTVGSITAVKSQAGNVPQQGLVHATIIEVQAPDTIGPTITKCRNTQNAIRTLHFVALDPNQERLRREMAISGITYHYRPSSEAGIENDTNIGVERAILALAVFSGKTEAVVAAKREIGQLFDQSSQFYGDLVRDNLSGATLARYVRIYSYLDGIMADSEAAGTGFFQRAFYRHGRLFTMHILARRYWSILNKAEYQLSEVDKVDLSRYVTDVAEIIWGIAESTFDHQKGYLAIFRNLGDSKDLARAVMIKLAELDAAGAAPEGQP